MKKMDVGLKNETSAVVLKGHEGAGPPVSKRILIV